MTKDEAIKKVLDDKPLYKVESVEELEKCYVVCIIPKNFDNDSDDLYIGGATRVDKNTGELSQFNPILEKN